MPGVRIDRRMTRPIGEVDDAVTIGRQAGRHRRPDHRRHRRLNCLQRCGYSALSKCLDVRNPAVVRQLGEEIPIGAVEPEDGHSRRDSARVAAQLGALRFQQRVAVDFQAGDLERRDFESALREMSGHRLPQHIALRVEL